MKANSRSFLIKRRNFFLLSYLPFSGDIFAEENKSSANQKGPYVPVDKADSSLFERVKNLYPISNDVIIVCPYSLTTKILNKNKGLAVFGCRVVKVLKGRMQFGSRITLNCYYEPEIGEIGTRFDDQITGEFRFVFTDYDKEAETSGIIDTDGWSMPKYSRKIEDMINTLK